MKKDYLYIGLGILAVGAFYWWSKNKNATTNLMPITVKKSVDPTTTPIDINPTLPKGGYDGSGILPPVLIHDYIPPIQNPNVPFTPVGAFKSNGGGGKSQPDVGAFNYQKLMTYANQPAPKN